MRQRLGQIDQSVERGILRDGGQLVFGGCGFTLWPFDQQPFLAARTARNFVPG
jgi:hypothetical protein